MKPHASFAATLLFLFVSPSALRAQATPPPHPDVGQKFVPTDVDWNHPLYTTSFDDAKVLQDWTLEGGKQTSIVDGKLVLESTPPEGNHLVYWLKKEMPADYLLEFSVKPQDRSKGLNIVFLNARARSGASIFDPGLRPRDGTFVQYHSGDLNSYHISYWAGDRGSANLRKNYGFHLVAAGKDLIASGPAGLFQTVRVYKRGGKIRLMVDDQIAVAYDDDGRTYGSVHTHSGWLGLRQMGHTVRCEYNHLKVYRLTQ